MEWTTEYFFMFWRHLTWWLMSAKKISKTIPSFHRESEQEDLFWIRDLVSHNKVTYLSWPRGVKCNPLWDDSLCPFYSYKVCRWERMGIWLSEKEYQKACVKEKRKKTMEGKKYPRIQTGFAFLIRACVCCKLCTWRELFEKHKKMRK